MSQTTEPPKVFKTHRFHWLASERAGEPSIAEVDANGKWYCVNEAQPVTAGGDVPGADGIGQESLRFQQGLMD